MTKKESSSKIMFLGLVRNKKEEIFMCVCVRQPQNPIIILSSAFAVRSTLCVRIQMEKKGKSYLLHFTSGFILPKYTYTENWM